MSQEHEVEAAGRLATLEARTEGHGHEIRDLKEADARFQTDRDRIVDSISSMRTDLTSEIGSVKVELTKVSSGLVALKETLIGRPVNKNFIGTAFVGMGGAAYALWEFLKRVGGNGG